MPLDLMAVHGVCIVCWKNVRYKYQRVSCVRYPQATAGISVKTFFKHSILVAIAAREGNQVKLFVIITTLGTKCDHCCGCIRIW